MEGLEQCLGLKPYHSQPIGFWEVLLSEKNLSPEGGRTAEPEFCVGAEALLLRRKTAREKIDEVLCASLQGVYPLAEASAHR